MKLPQNDTIKIEARHGNLVTNDGAVEDGPAHPPTHREALEAAQLGTHYVETMDDPLTQTLEKAYFGSFRRLLHAAEFKSMIVRGEASNYYVIGVTARLPIGRGYEGVSCMYLWAVTGEQLVTPLEFLTYC